MITTELIIFGSIATALLIVNLIICYSTEKKIRQMHIKAWEAMKEKPRTLYVKQDWTVVSFKQDKGVLYVVQRGGIDMYKSNSKYKAFAELKRLQDREGA